MSHAGLAAGLEQRILAQIPLARAMQIAVVSFDGQRVCLRAPLAPNINDKGTGFAGSLSTLVTLAGWSLATLLGEQALADAGVAGGTCEAAVYRSELEFLRPVRTDLDAEAWLIDATALPRLAGRLESGRRVKLSLAARLGPETDPAVQFRGDYALWRAGMQPF